MKNEYWNKSKAFHGHECPGLAIGVAASIAAIEKLGINSSKDEEIVCVTENDACGVDAIQAILSCTFGKGNLIYRATGKMAFTFFSRENNKNLRMYYKAEKPDSMSRSDYISYILDSPYDDLWVFSEPKFSLPETARLFSSVVCSECGERAPELKIRLQNGSPVCLDCFKSYDRGL